MATVGEDRDPVPNNSLIYLLAGGVGTANQDLLQNGQSGQTVISQYGLTLTLKWLNVGNPTGTAGTLKVVLKAQVAGLPTISVPVFEVGVAANSSSLAAGEKFKLWAPPGYSFQVYGTTSTFDVQAGAYFSEG